VLPIQIHVRERFAVLKGVAGSQFAFLVFESRFERDVKLVAAYRQFEHGAGQLDRADHAARLRRCAALLDLGPFLDTPVRQLSLGQRMRGELTAALLHGPEVLFLDEPTIGLDVVSKQAVRSFLAELGEGGDVTLVLTTHDLADIERLCRRLVVIDHGRVVHDGTIEALHARYGSRRRLVVDLDEPLPPGFTLPGASLADVAADGHRVTFALDSASAGAAVAGLVAAAAVRDLSVVEPDIEDVVARLYSATDAP